MSVNETVNQSQSATAGGSGEKPEKLVADHVEKSWEYITENGFDLLADVAVDTLVKNGAVPSDAYLHSVKTSWCLHRAAVHYARQYSVERVSADFARRDAQFEHSLRAQAEREAEKLKADLAQSVLLVESQRLRIEEARAEGAEWCEEINKLRGSLGARREELTASFTANQELRQKLETAEAALLEQQQRNEELVTQNSQQFMKIAELQRQVEGVTEPEAATTTEQLADTSGRDIVQGLVLQVADLIQREEAEIERQPEAQPEPQQYTPPEGWRVVRFGEELLPGDQWVNWEGTVSRPDILHGDGTRASGGRYIRRIKPEPQPEPQQYTPPEGWRALAVGEPLQNGDQFIPESGAVEVLWDVKTELAQPNGHYIRQIEPEVVQPLMLQDADVGIRMLRQCNQNQYEKIVSMRDELNQVKGELAGAIQSRDLLAETNREQAGKIEHLQRQVEALTILGL